jgi:microcystin-dependent protein
MPRNGSGTMSIVHTASVNTVITSSDWNQNLDDVAEELTNSLALDGQSTMTGQIKAANGTAAAPAIAFGSDTDTGWYRSGADEMSAATAGTQRLAVSSAGLDVKSGHYRKGGSIMSLVPIGTVLDYAGSGGTVPAGWLLCAGQEIPQSTFAALFAVLGPTYNLGTETVGHFRVPDLRGRVVAGKDDMGTTGAASRLTSGGSGVNGASLGGSGGAQTHVLTEPQLASHSHGTGTLATQASGGHTHSLAGTSTADGGSHTHTVVGDVQGAGLHDHSGSTGDDSPDHTHTFTRYNSQVNIPQGAGASVTGLWTNDQVLSTGGANQRHTHGFSIEDSGSHSHVFVNGFAQANGSHAHGLSGDVSTVPGHSHTVSGASAPAGGNAAHNNVQPTMILNKIIFAGA